MNKRPYFLIALLFLCDIIAMAQPGTIRGQVFDQGTGETLIGVTVVIDGTTLGSVTDLDGKFEIRVETGVYRLRLSYVSYSPMIIDDVAVQAKEVTELGRITMVEEVGHLDEVVISAQAIRTTEEAMLTVRRKSFVVMDGISSAAFSRIGDGDAAAAAKRVTGVSIEDGKYAYVRGLGDRYSKTTLNGMEIPGLDPDRNTVQIDLFPTSLIDNLVVVKSASANMPADFTGGLINIETKDFPDEKVFDVSFSIGYNPSMHFNNDFIGHRGGKLDFLGFDDGTRALPVDMRKGRIPSPSNGSAPEQVNTLLRKFNPLLGAERERSFMDYGLGISIADQHFLDNGHKLGYIFALNYKSETRFFEDVVYGEYQRLPDPGLFEFRDATIQTGSVGEQAVLWGGTAGFAYQTEHSKYKVTIMRLQNGESRTGRFNILNNGEAIGQSGYHAVSDNLEFTQRYVSNLMMSGDHSIPNNRWKVNWRVSPTVSGIHDPDIRRTAFTIEPNRIRFDAGAGGNPIRIWRRLDEFNVAGGVDATLDYSLFGRPARLAFGASHVHKNRDYEILSFELQSNGGGATFDDADANSVLIPENLFPNGPFYYTSGNADPNPNAFNSFVNNTGVHVSNEFLPFDRLKGVIGLRLEKYVQYHTGRDVAYATLGTGNNLVDAKVLDAFDLFPSMNLIYAVNDSQNLRLSVTRTTARPSFKEMSFAQIIDPMTNRIFNGGLFSYPDWNGKLESTRINNLDIRWEVFPDNGELVSLSVFYKSFSDPIELVRIPEQQTSTEYQPRNVGDGRVYGLELEVRKDLGFLFPKLKFLSISGNVTAVRSTIEMTDREYNARKAFERDGERITRTRRMAGQAPFIINAGILYARPEKGMEAGIYYHVKGPTLSIVGTGIFPDVYVSTFHSLNLNIAKVFGRKKRTSLIVNAANLLNDVREEVYSGYHAADRTFSRYAPGFSASIAVRHSF